MKTEKKRLPIGMENFEDIRSEEFYYVDKTGLIKELLSDLGGVNLFTRPRRFGKTLNMNMLRNFFEIGCDRKMFEGLAISKEHDICERYMGRFPVISISLKGVNGRNYDEAYQMLCNTIRQEALRHQYLLESDKLSQYDVAPLHRILEEKAEPADVKGSLLMLSYLLYKHYGKKTIILIDEYDVPLDKANENGYYEEMIMLIRSMFEQTLKTNEYLYFAVLTGCLRVSRESIFTGLNNLKVMSITDVGFDEYFGFTDSEVRELLAYYDLTEAYDTIREWYDGYHFGNVDVYCPWDVMNYCSKLLADREALPEAFWANSSSNGIVRRFIEHAKVATKREIEKLIAGESICKEVTQELTYKDLEDAFEQEQTDDLWSVLFMTGYLTQRGRLENGQYELVIPNREVRQIFEKQIWMWFDKKVKNDRTKLEMFCQAFKEGNVDEIEKTFTSYLKSTISIRDTYTKSPKENFYHGILLGLLRSEEEWILSSNAETGEGYSDILIEMEEEEIGCIIELKYAPKEQLDAACEEALQQVTRLDYAEKLREEGIEKIYVYGIACFKKMCKVKMQQM